MSDKPAGSFNQPASARRLRPDEPLEVHIEFVVLDGEAGRLLRQRQAAIMRKVLRWLHDNPANASGAPAGTDEPTASSMS
jgi:hypothetical protein